MTALNEFVRGQHSDTVVMMMLVTIRTMRRQ